MLLKTSNLLLAKMAVVVSCLHVCWTNKTIFGMQTINAPNDCPPSPSAAVSTCVCVCTYTVWHMFACDCYTCVSVHMRGTCTAQHCT